MKQWNDYLPYRTKESQTKLLVGQKWLKSFEVTKILSDFVLPDKVVIVNGI